MRDSQWEREADSRYKGQQASKGGSRGGLVHTQGFKRTVAGPGDQKRGERIPRLCGIFYE